MKQGNLSPAGMRARPGGGFNAAPGGLSEHMDEAAMQQALSAQAQSQQTGAISPQQVAQTAATQASSTQQPREMGTLGEEVERMGSDVVEGIKDFLSFATWFGLDPQTMTPEEKQRLKTVHTTYQKLDQEQQAYARQKYQQEQQRKKQQEEEAAMRRRQQEEAANKDVIVPKSPQKGARGFGGSKKQKATQMLQDKRKKLGGLGDIN